VQEKRIIPRKSGTKPRGWQTSKANIQMRKGTRGIQEVSVLRRCTTSAGTSITVYAFRLEEHGYDGTGANQTSTYYDTLDGCWRQWSCLLIIEQSLRRGFCAAPFSPAGGRWRKGP